VRNKPARKLPDSAHYSQPWRIHEIAPEFRLEDVWALPAAGAREDFPRLIRLLSTPGTAESSSLLTRLLFAVRRVLGRWLRWDDAVGDTDATSLRHRLPDDLRDRRSTAADTGPFTTLYETDDEWAAELENRTVHGVLHVGWVADGTGRYRGQLAVLVKPAGRLGTTYLIAIRPFRYAIVYPALLRNIDRKWRTDALGRP